MSNTEIDDKIKQIRVECINTNKELASSIKQCSDKLNSLKKELEISEKPFREEIDRLLIKKKLLENKNEAIKSVKSLKKQVNHLYSIKKFDEKDAYGNYTELVYVFIGNRFCNYVYNDSVPKSFYFYSNEGGSGDANWLVGPKYIVKEDDVIFDNYKAYEIAGSKLTPDEKFIKLNEMFDLFLNAKWINTEPKTKEKPKETSPQQKSGFEVVMENGKLKNKDNTKKAVEKNLQTFKLKYNRFKENPTDEEMHKIHIDTLTEYQIYTINAIRNFLVSEEKWPDNKISIDSKNGITVNFAIDGWFSDGD